MKPEEYLDRLIESREQGLEPFLITDDKVAAGLAAAQMLGRLNELDVPPDFARRLERTIRLRTRERAYENNGSLPTTNPLQPVPRTSRSLRPRRPSLRHAWIAALGIAAALMLACIGILTVSARSLPGDPLYGLKQATEQFRLNFSSSPQDRVNDQIDQLHSSLVDLNTVVSSGRSDDAISIALNAIADNTKSARESVAALPPGPDHDTAQQNLQNAISEEDQTLRGLLNQVDWSIKVAFTAQLGALGDPVPTITHVSTLIQSNGTLLITLTGTHFAPGARLVIDGQPAGTVTGDTQDQLTVILNNAAGLSDRHGIGVINPDGTAAQRNYEDDPQDDGPGNYHPGHGTPTPNRGSDDDSGSDD